MYTNFPRRTRLTVAAALLACTFALPLASAQQNQPSRFCYVTAPKSGDSPSAYATSDRPNVQNPGLLVKIGAALGNPQQPADQECEIYVTRAESDPETDEISYTVCSNRAAVANGFEAKCIGTSEDSYVYQTNIREVDWIMGETHHGTVFYEYTFNGELVDTSKLGEAFLFTF